MADGPPSDSARCPHCGALMLAGWQPCSPREGGGVSAEPPTSAEGAGGSHQPPAPPTDNLGGLVLLLHALAREGRHPTVVDRSWVGSAGWHLHDVDHVVVEDQTWRAWADAGFPGPGVRR